MKTIIFTAILTLLSGCTTSREIATKRLFGLYSPFSMDSGISLNLSENNTFAADWWIQNMKTGNFDVGRVIGRWHLERESIIVLRYEAKERNESEARFTVEEINGNILLRLVRSGDFPLVAFFGEEYQKKNEPNKAVEPTTIHVTNPAYAGFAPCMVAAHF